MPARRAGAREPGAARVNRAALGWLGAAAALAALDQLTKAGARAALELHRPLELLPFLDLTLTHNPGAAFSLLAAAGGWQRWLFVILTAAIAAALALWLWRVAGRERRLPAALAAIIGGAVGNLVDRLRFGYVVDFVDFHAGGWHWPAFNLADAAITCGAIALVALGLLRRS